MTLFMETTEIAPERTVQEIQKVLAKYGASAVMMEFDQTRSVAAVAFRYDVVGTGSVPFRLPCRWEAIADILRKRAGIGDQRWAGTWDSDKRRRAAIEEKARRVAWRQTFRWIEAQLAYTETGMVKVEEVFFSYIQMKGGKTLFQKHAEQGFTALLEYKPDGA
jgi:hypothetical protein